jgi:hypothetical protein
MDIKEIAEKIRIEVLEEFGYQHRYTQEESIIKQGQERLISAYKAELLKEVGEPGAYQVGNSYPRLDGTLAKIVGIGNQTVVDDEGCHYYNRAQDRGRVTGTAHDYSYPRNLVRYYTSDQVAAAIIKATKPLEDQLAKAEQRVAEACSAYMLNKNYNSLEFDRKYSAKEFCAGQKSTVEFLAKMIHKGEWRKFVKEEV